MTRERSEFAVDEDGDAETERLDTFSDLADLFVAMQAWVFVFQLDTVDGSENN